MAVAGTDSNGTGWGGKRAGPAAHRRRRADPPEMAAQGGNGFVCDSGDRTFTCFCRRGATDAFPCNGMDRLCRAADQRMTCTAAGWCHCGGLYPKVRQLALGGSGPATPCEGADAVRHARSSAGRLRARPSTRRLADLRGSAARHGQDGNRHARRMADRSLMPRVSSPIASRPVLASCTHPLPATATATVA